MLKLFDRASSPVLANIGIDAFSDLDDLEVKDLFRFYFSQCAFSSHILLEYDSSCFRPWTDVFLDIVTCIEMSDQSDISLNLSVEVFFFKLGIS